MLSARKKVSENPVDVLGNNHTYGKKVVPDVEGALKVVLSWKENQPHRDETPDRDFKKLNVLSLKEKQVSSSQISNFRKSHDARITSHKKEKKADLLPSDVDPSFAYGHRNVFDQKAKDLMEHRFAEEWAKKKEETDRRFKEDKKQEMLSSVNTRAKLDIMKRSEDAKIKLTPREDDSSNQFKMTKFKNVPSKVDCKRDSHPGYSFNNNDTSNGAEEASANAQNIVEISDVNKLIAYHPESREGLLYSFDNCFDSETTNNTIFESVCVPVLNAVIEGYNGTIISYGSSRTGKTEMMIGNEREEGIVDLTFREGYSYLSSVSDKVDYSISFSFWEMSNDSILDLLDLNEGKELKLKRSGKEGVFITNLSEHQVDSWEHLQSLIDNGIRRSQQLTAQRKIRLHSFMRLRLTRNNYDHPEEDVSSSFMFVNLKGTERIGKIGAKGDHMKEGASLNMSMIAFGNAIHNVVNHTRVKKDTAININSLFGDSQVTAMMSDSLGGKSATVIIGSISQTEFHYLETMEVLENLRIARHILSKPVKQVLNSKIKKLYNKIKKLETSIPEDKLAPGHPPTEQQEELEYYKRLYRKYLDGLVDDEDLDKPMETNPSLQDIPELELSKTDQLWKQNDAKSQRHGIRATVYKPSSLQGKPKETYKGQWKGHQKHGYGEVDNEKVNYKGGWANDKKHGKGSLYSKEKNRRVFLGEFQNDKKHGKGVFYYENGEIYDGEWKDDKRCGYGVMYYLDGTKYEGEWENDMRGGNGACVEKNGDRFEGSFLNGLKHGPGVYYYITQGQKYVGEWFKGVAKCGQLYSDIDYTEEGMDSFESSTKIPENQLQDRMKVIEDAVTSVRIQMQQEHLLPSAIRENIYE
ncbi:kinesin [Naegleria gruberi]|uniref:Kinesin n=1 Tax=Naegleria gruberi TaxID=5762 RepID=D2UYB8_NAEGR|nr:kinesin [Naegleria gruberi]EFC50447.1 kinesin [Naegleria gruberi]|eukprot:XP_002683191.1 kinesin [Naegleria gruberi]